MPTFSRNSTLLFVIIGIMLLGGTLTAGIVNSNKNSNKKEGQNKTEKTIQTPSKNEADTLQIKELHPSQSVALPPLDNPNSAPPSDSTTCSNNANILFMLDVSGSMDLGGKNSKPIDKLKEAVISTTNMLSNNSLIGIHTYATKISTVIPLSSYEAVKNEIANKVNALQTGPATHTYDALSYELDLIKQAKETYPDKDFNLIFISDGVPNLNASFGEDNCTTLPVTKTACQDPRKFNPNPAGEIKKLGVPVYSIGLYASNELFSSDFRALMSGIATDKNHYYEAPSSNDLQKILQEISQEICEKSAI